MSDYISVLTGGWWNSTGIGDRDEVLTDGWWEIGSPPPSSTQARWELSQEGIWTWVLDPIIGAVASAHAAIWEFFGDPWSYSAKRKISVLGAVWTFMEDPWGGVAINVAPVVPSLPIAVSCMDNHHTRIWDMSRHRPRFGGYTRR